MARRRIRPDTELSAFLDAAIKRKGLNHTQFSRAVGQSPSSVSDIKLRQVSSTKNLARTRKWAAVLELDEGQRKELFLLLELSGCPSFVRAQVTQGGPVKAIAWVAEPPLDYR